MPSVTSSTPNGRTKRSTCNAPPPALGSLDTPLRRHARDPIPTPRWRRARHRLRPHLHAPQAHQLLAGQKLGIKEVDDGIWLVSFHDYDLGYIDLEQKTLQPLDNPFGPRLSPMS